MTRLESEKSASARWIWSSIIALVTAVIFAVYISYIVRWPVRSFNRYSLHYSGLPPESVVVYRNLWGTRSAALYVKAYLPHHLARSGNRVMMTQTSAWERSGGVLESEVYDPTRDGYHTIPVITYVLVDGESGRELERLRR